MPELKERRPRIVLITPLKDEQAYVEAMILSVLKQELRPQRWILVDDGSTDSTAAIIHRYRQRYSFIELISLPVRTERLAGGEEAIATALRSVDLAQIDFLARFDADLVLSDDYFVQILRRFAVDEHLGIAGGTLFIDRHGVEVTESAPEYHVRGALKMYRAACFRDVGPLGTEIGWDTMDEVRAWIHGWHTRSFLDIRVHHRRPTGGGVFAPRIYRERGRAEYLTWSHPLFVLVKAIKLMLRSPRNAWHFLQGFFRCYQMRTERTTDPAFRQTRRRQQSSRILCALTLRPHQPGASFVLTAPSRSR